jgi:hypothetical protein
MQGRIKIGAMIGHDRSYGKWPACFPSGCSQTGKYEADDPNMIFDVEWKGSYWNCKADGFGMLRCNGEVGEYGNGSIFVFDRDGVELLANHLLSRQLA